MTRIEERPLVATALRLAVAGFCWLTALYAFVTSRAFVFHELIRPHLFQWVNTFSARHVWLYWLWVPLALLDVRWHLREPGVRRWFARGFAAAIVAAGVGLAFAPVLPRLTDTPWSLVTGLVALVPVVWLAALDHAAAWSGLTEPRASDPAMVDRTEARLLGAAAGAALLVTVIYALWTATTVAGAAEPDLPPAGLAIGLVLSAAGHLLISALAFVTLALTVRLLRPARRLLVPYAAVGLLLALSVALLVRRTLGDAVGLDGGWGALVAVALGVSIVATWGALRIRRAPASAFVSPVDAFFGPPPDGPPSARWLVRVALVAAGAYALAAIAGRLDWDFTLLTLGVVAVWFAAFDAVYCVMPLSVSAGAPAVALVCLLPIGAYVGGTMVESRMAPGAAASRATIGRVLDRYAVYNPSFRTVRAMLRDKRGDRPAFDAFLAAHTGLAGMSLTPANVDFVQRLTASPVTPKPFIFLFVIDSLRPDYLQPYNPAVGFTPNLEAFAADSFVYRNAFAAFGGTALSVPSIWSGSALLHKQYVHPFHPMNGLEKLLDANAYRYVMSVDVIVQELLLPHPSAVDLDRGRQTTDFEFCRTLAALESHLPPKADAEPPIFAYSLPQDLHIGKVRRIGAAPVDSYPGFYAPVASRVHRIDACFGAFVHTLKQRGLYDRSIIVVTADHGDMLGEDGQWGHAYYLFPQVLEVPLIVHVPGPIARRVSVDENAVSTLTDITPTLYAALGYPPERPSPLMGEPLIEPNGPSTLDTWNARRRESYVMASSYGAVYAVLRQNGRRLYIADAIKGGDSAFDRDATGAWTAVKVTEGLRTANQRRIREYLDELSREYHLNGAQ